ncbi:hypothetical protein HN971_00860, partial [archaeon]|nr:hypothetical protein [archaeon]
PKQKGSASIKAVLPVLSDLKYSDLEISEGMFASLEYERVTYDPSVSEETRAKRINFIIGSAEMGKRNLFGTQDKINS